MVCPAAKRSRDAQTCLNQLCRVDAGIARAQTLVQAFLSMVRERRGDELEAWMAEATQSGIEELARFARGLRDDLIAVKAGLTLTWSNGVTEGQIHPLKLVKRQSYGRASRSYGSASYKRHKDGGQPTTRDEDLGHSP
jgi:transposase